MSDPHHTKIRGLFEQAIDLPSNERAAFLAANCHDTSVRRRVEALLTRESEHRDEPTSPNLVLDANPLEALLLNKEAGRSKLVEVLGSGGMGIVFRAEQRRPRRDVAVKVLTVFRHGSDRRFEQEVDIQGALDHPGVCKVFDVGRVRLEHGDLPYYSMELVRGGKPITAYVAAHDLPRLEVLRLLIKVCEAVAHAHENGVIHRDLKPANILVGADGGPKVIDFGIAKYLHAGHRDLTLTGELRGTIDYMSPEHLRDGRADTRTDVYALGAVLYELISGHKLHDARQRAPGARTGTEQSLHLYHNDQTIGKDLEAILLKALCDDPRERYSNATEMADDIRRHVQGEPTRARPPGVLRLLALKAKPLREKALLTASVVAASLIVGTAFWLRDDWYSVPNHIWLDPTGQLLELRSKEDTVLRTWDSMAKDGIRNAIYHDERIYLIFTDKQPRYPPGLSVIDPSLPQDQEIVWSPRIEDKHVPEHQISKHAGADFLAGMFRFADIYPSTPEWELVVIFQHRSGSASCLRVYEVKKRDPKFQVWHDGNIKDFFWSQRANQLVIAGLNGEHYWEDLVGPKALGTSLTIHAHPQVLESVMFPTWPSCSKAQIWTPPGVHAIA